MDIEEARRLDLVDQQHELADRLYMLHRGIANYVIVSARERHEILARVEALQPWSEQDRDEFEELRAQVRGLTRLLTDFDVNIVFHQSH